MALSDMITVFMYVDPENGNVDKMTCFTPFGMTERVDSDWQQTTRAESGVDELTEHKIYKLDWDTDFLAMDADDDGKEHAAVDLFDKGTLTEDGCKKYGKLHLDPANVDGDPEAEALVKKLNAEGK